MIMQRSTIPCLYLRLKYAKEKNCQKSRMPHWWRKIVYYLMRNVFWLITATWAVTHLEIIGYKKVNFFSWIYSPDTEVYHGDLIIITRIDLHFLFNKNKWGRTTIGFFFQQTSPSRKPCPGISSLFLFTSLFFPPLPPVLTLIKFKAFFSWSASMKKKPQRRRSFAVAFGLG